MVWAYILLFVAAAGAFLSGKSLISTAGSATSSLFSNPILWGLGLLALWLLLRRGGSAGHSTTNVIIKNTDDDTYLRRRWR